eukprot:1147112-Pelagomonas_calceolata.AAC.2
MSGKTQLNQSSNKALARSMNMKEGIEMDCPLQIVPAPVLTESLESVQELLTRVRFYNALLRSNSLLCSAVLVMKEIVVLRKRLQGAWNADALAEHSEHTNRLANYHHWVALPLKPLSIRGASFPVPRPLHLDSGKHMLRNIARFCLHAHTVQSGGHFEIWDFTLARAYT